MSQAKPDRTTLGPGQEILDPNLRKRIQNTPALSPIDLLKIANYYMNRKVIIPEIDMLAPNSALAIHLFLIAQKIFIKNQAHEMLSPSPPPVEATALASAVAPTTAVSPHDEWTDQWEDFINGYSPYDPEDVKEAANPLLPGGVIDIRWLPFSTSLPEFGLLVETATAFSGVPSEGEVTYYIIGSSPDASRLPTD